MSESAGQGVGRPLANYAASRRLGGMVFMSGVIAVDPVRAEVITRYDQLPAQAIDELKRIGFVTGQMSVDVFEAPAVAQSWFVLDRIRQLAQQEGCELQHTARLVQYFRDLRHYPLYNRVRSLFYPEPVVSTVVEVSRMLPDDRVVIEVEATLVAPAGTTIA